MTLERFYRAKPEPNGPTKVAVGRDTLTRLFRVARARQGAEIGVWEGGFSARLCRANPGVRLMCVDPWTAYDGYVDSRSNQGALDRAYSAAVKRLSVYGCDIRRGNSQDVAKGVGDHSLDFVYLDANHGEAAVRSDLETWSRKVSCGGFMSGHDCADVPSRPYIQVRPAVESFVREHGISPWFLLTGDRSPSFVWQVS